MGWWVQGSRWRRSTGSEFVDGIGGLIMLFGGMPFLLAIVFCLILFGFIGVKVKLIVCLSKIE